MSRVLSRYRIAIVLPLLIGLIALVSVAVTGTLAYLRAAGDMTVQAEEKMMALREGRTNALGTFLDNIESDIRITSNNETVARALKDFGLGFDAARRNAPGNDVVAALQGAYIDGNPHPEGEKDKLDAAPDGTWYDEQHALYHAWFRALQRERGYYDVFLISPDGDVIYTVFKEADFATNLTDGQWAGSGLAEAYRHITEDPRPDAVTFVDFAAYAPSGNAPASFIAGAVFDEDGDFAGVLAFQMPIGRINDIMQIEAGMGESGEAYLVGTDLLMRSDSRFSDQSTILARTVETETARAALAGESGVRQVADYRGVPVVSAFGPIDVQGVRWAVLAEVDVAEVMAPVVAMEWFLILAGIGILVVVGLLGILFARAITRPLAAMTGAMGRLAEGDLSVTIPATERRDELGDMSHAMAVFKTRFQEAEDLKAAQERERQEAEAARRKSLLAMADRFERDVSGVVEAVSSAATELETSANGLTGVADRASSNATTVAGAAEQTAANVETVATATEELAASIQEIARQVEQARTTAETAVQEADRTTEEVRALDQAADNIGEVLSLINDIASQTNLLALNATIEAARAGEAGKGFAVVANEVKALAGQTARATDDIDRHIKEVQANTQHAVKAIEHFAATVGRIGEISAAVAAAVEQQNAAIGEVSRNTAEAAGGTQEVSRSIGDVTAASEEAGGAAREVLGAAGELSRRAADLSSAVNRFLQGVRQD
ncbi:methyl-accepting chemotaxis protein [Roseospira navarrensis]|uniref:HAMP domain-containing protein n=1 Tax=Roseospira navarrensis TaxID=140058 RepID=A0A7X1ZCT7_9PROT|nr:methyl-accepting chemotaxis protein [Roseospira navarrensis]MQX36194.1 HAMP domain-containing protein [Roseospira navarrensis]